MRERVAMRVVRVFQRVSRPLDSLFSSGGARGGWACCARVERYEVFDDVGYKKYYFVGVGIIIYYSAAPRAPTEPTESSRRVIVVSIR